jgi:hypothetical protein
LQLPTPAKGKISVAEDLEAVLRKTSSGIRTQLPVLKSMLQDRHGAWNGVRWDGQHASFFALGEADEKKPKRKLLGQ